MGVLPIAKALQVARERNLDLVEVATNASPPVCRILDYGKYKYQQAKKERESGKGKKSSPIHEVRLRPRIDGHDLASKVKLIKRLLDEGGKVKVTVIFRGREVTRPELGKKVLQQALSDLKDVAVVDQPLLVEQRRLTILLTPQKVTKKTEKPEKTEKVPVEVSHAKNENA